MARGLPCRGVAGPYALPLYSAIGILSNGPSPCRTFPRQKQLAVSEAKAAQQSATLAQSNAQNKVYLAHQVR